MELFDLYWPHIATLLTIFVNVLATGHILINKRDTSTATGWLGLVWMAPIIGATLYLIMGVNRIRRQAREKRRGRVRTPPSQLEHRIAPEAHVSVGGSGKDYLANLSRLVERVTGQPLLQGNLILPLVGCEQAFPEMTDAIRAAKKSVALCTYIFDNDPAGVEFLEALLAAKARGVEIRVLVDAVGARYTLPPMTYRLRKSGLRTARFMPTALPWRFRYSNLRNHRKILVIDGELAFTGGMNIRSPLRHPMQDLHFKVEGPVVRQLADAFVEDWSFTTGETLSGETWFPRLSPKGNMAARGIADGPDEDFEMIRWTVMGAIACAQSSVTIFTPYFIPDTSLLGVLAVAALRGVQVTVALPEENNLILVQWATMASLDELLERSVRVFLTKPPFDHTKLMIVDERWVLIGSANWDPRSFRLNFEYDIESYDEGFAAQMVKIGRKKLEGAKELTAAGVHARPLPVRLRDNVVRLFSPYL